MKEESFSHQVKDEVARQWPKRRCCRSAELSALTRIDGRLRIRGEGSHSLFLEAENAAVTRCALRLFNDLYGIQGEVLIRRSRLSGANNYMISIEDRPNLAQALNELGVLDDSLTLRADVPKRLLKNKCCSGAFVRGLFLGGGFVGHPRGAYQLEITCHNRNVMDLGRELLSRFGIEAKVIEKRNRYTLYLKQAQAILDFLALIGAFSAILTWEDIMTVKDVRGGVNRRVNCDTANLNKAVEAAMGQLRDIERIEDLVGLADLPPALRDIAEARVANPQANLTELGEMCMPKLSKSAVYHRIRRLHEYAARI